MHRARRTFKASSCEPPWARRPLPCGAGGCKLVSRVAAAQYMAVAECNLLDVSTRAMDTRVAYAVEMPPEGTRPPGQVPSDRVYTFPETGVLHESTPDTIVTGKRPSPLSCSPVAPGTTRSAANDPATALQRRRRTPVRSYLRHSPRLLRLKHLDDDPGTGDHPGGSSPSRASDARLLNGHVAGSWAPGLASYVRPPGRHSFRGARQGRAPSISASRNEKRSLTHRRLA